MAEPHALIVTDMEWSDRSGLIVTFECYPTMTMAYVRAWNWMREAIDDVWQQDPPCIHDIEREIRDWNENTDNAWVHVRPIIMEEYA